MKTNLIVYNGHYLKPIVEAVCVGAYGVGDHIDELLEDGYVDIFTGELFGKSGVNYVHATPTWCQTWKVDSRRYTKKDRRVARIDAICGINWTELGMKRIGKNRKMSRIMYPNAAQRAEYENYLPF